MGKEGATIGDQIRTMEGGNKGADEGQRMPEERLKRGRRV